MTVDAAHQHQLLGPFDVGADPSRYDEAIAALAGAIVSGCENCAQEQAAVLGTDTEAFNRVTDLVGRAYPGYYGPLRIPGSSRTNLVADYVDLAPTERATAIEQVAPEGRAELTRMAAGVLAGAWIHKQMDAEAPERAAAKRRRIAQRYGIEEAADTEPGEAWALMHAATRSRSDSDRYVVSTGYALHIARIDDGTHLLGPIELYPGAEWIDVDAIFELQSWVPGGAWKEVDPEQIRQGGWAGPDGTPAGEHSDRLWAKRLRRPDHGTPASPTPSIDASTQLGRLRAYLTTQGWQRPGHTWRGASVWTHHSGQVVSLPDTVEHDVALRVRDAVEGIARAEGRDPAEVEADLSGT